MPIKLSFFLDKLLLNNSSKSIYLHYFLWKKKANNLAVQLHKKNNFDVAHHVSYGSFQQGSSLYKVENCKNIFGPVGGGQMALPIFKKYFGSSWRIEIVRKWVSSFLLNYSSSLRQTIKNADVVLAVNEETEDLLKTSKYYREGQCSLVSDSALSKQFELPEFDEFQSSKILNLLWIGRLLPRKGLELSLKALSYLPNDFPYKLTIVGDGEQRKFLDLWIKKYKLDASKIECLGWIPFSKVSEEYKKNDVMLFCTLRDTAGLQATEAMGYGLPIITMNISGMRTIVPENCGVKINPSTTEGTAQDIAKAIAYLHHNPEYRVSAGRNAYNTALKNTWSSKIDFVTSRYY